MAQEQQKGGRIRAPLPHPPQQLQPSCWLLPDWFGWAADTRVQLQQTSYDSAEHAVPDLGKHLDCFAQSLAAVAAAAVQAAAVVAATAAAVAESAAAVDAWIAKLDCRLDPAPAAGAVEEC